MNALLVPYFRAPVGTEVEDDLYTVFKLLISGFEWLQLSRIEVMRSVRLLYVEQEKSDLVK